MTEDGQKTEYTLRMEVVAANLGLKDSIHIGINVMLTSCTRWDSIMVLVQVTNFPCCCLLLAILTVLTFAVLNHKPQAVVASSCALHPQDLGHLFDEINVSTAMHRAAKLSRKYEVR